MRPDQQVGVVGHIAGACAARADDHPVLDADVGLAHAQHRIDDHDIADE